MLYRIANILNPPTCASADERIKKMWLIYIITFDLGIQKGKLSFTGK